MFDFLMITTRTDKKGAIEVYPKFRLYPKSTDLMIRGGDFYAIWLEDMGLWSTDEQEALMRIDRALKAYVDDHKERLGSDVKIKYMWDSESGMIDAWHRYCQKQSRDNFKILDEKLIFSNTETNKKDYASKRLKYPLEPGDITHYDKLMSVLYTETERHKIEWAIGSIVSGGSKKLQKFMVLYGAAGTGKSTVLNIVQQLFEGYYSVFDAKALGSSTNVFALEAFKDNPLVAIQHDGDLSRIEDNTRLNSLVSHEEMTINEKFKSTYKNRFKCFLFMGTNKPVKITEAKSGLMRRLIDVSPSGNKLRAQEYDTIVKNIKFELGAIAHHCQEIYLNNPNYYDGYTPTAMLSASNDFYNYILDSFPVFKQEDGTTLKAAWKMYNVYCEEAKVSYPMSQRVFKEELKNYFHDYKERHVLDDGTRVRSYFIGFRTDKLSDDSVDESEKKETQTLLEFYCNESIFDIERSDCLAQYTTADGIPLKKWEKVKTTLAEIDTSKLHFVKVPENHIVIDFDLRGEDGEKSLERNIAEASKWPRTYAELSKSGKGVHLHYIYKGDVTQLSRIYDDNIEIKVFTGNSSLRRKLTRCNDLPIATISSGLPLKGVDKMVNFEALKNEKALRTLIKRCLAKEYHGATKPNIDLIYKNLEDAYNNGLKYDVSNLRNAVLTFAAGSTNQADYCIKLVNKMKFKSEEPSEPGISNEDDPLIFYDVEVFPNLFLVNWKVQGEGKKVVRMINPKPAEIEELICHKLVGFNCRRYDNHMLYARLIGYDNERLYKLSQKIVNSKKGENMNYFFGEAYNISYTDVYDFASAGNKKSLKKFEIELGIHHQELGLPWDQPVPEEKWQLVAEYCDNDVIATEAVFNHLKSDWTARCILADLANGSRNDTTNTLTTRFIFGNNRSPQNQFMYRDLSKPVHSLPDDVIEFLKEACPEMMAAPHGKAKSLLPYFEGYKFEFGTSTYKGEKVGEGGAVRAEPGIHYNVALLDIASQHPHSAIAECLFGPEFTRRFREIVLGRVNIKHEAWDIVNKMLDGALTPYIEKVIAGEMTSGDLADALKTAINSVYGLTSAKYPNAFRDPRNVDNIVAKRGALFMLTLKEEIEKRGFTAAHIKTDSIKIPNATPEIIRFVMDFGKRYGYTFEHEATYSRMCLVNDAVYIARCHSTEWCEKTYGYVPSKQKKLAGKWTATGTQFAVPYVFKTLFSGEEIEFEDLCETKEVKTALYLDMNERLPENDHDYRFIGKVGNFCPIKNDCGGGLLMAERKDKEGNVKYDSATGAKDYRWLEAEMVKRLGKEDDIDKSYYRKLVDGAVSSISEYGDFEHFISDDDPGEKIGSDVDKACENIPWVRECGRDTCHGCPFFYRDQHHMECKKGYDISDIIYGISEINKNNTNIA